MCRVIAPVLVFASLGFAQTTGSVTGVVVDRVTGAGIPGASVTFYIRTQGVLAEATADAAGEFRIFGMKPGSYEVRFEKDGFRSGSKIPAQPYIVGQTPSPVRIRLEMTRLVSLSGRVVDADGNPVSQAEVKIATRIAIPADADGGFVTKDLEPGSYTLAAIPKASRVAEGARVPVITYSPEPVVIRGDADISGVEIRLQTAEVYRISGVVLDETGNPKSHVTVHLMPVIQTGPRVVTFGDFITLVGPGPYTGPEEARVVSEENGYFEFPNVRSGQWRLAALSTGPIDSVDYINSFHSGASGVVVGSRNVENFQIRQAAAFKISGTVEWRDAPSRRVGVILTPVDGRAVLTWPGSTDSNGTLSFAAVTPGKYVIVPQPGSGYYPVSVLVGGQEVLGKPVDLSPGSALRVTYRAATGSVQGTVENSGEAPVLLIPREVQTMAFGRMVTCKSDGTFNMSGVPPGDYFAVAFDWFQRTDPSGDAAWLAKVAAIGTRVSVAQGSVSVQLKKVPYFDSK